MGFASNVAVKAPRIWNETPSRRTFLTAALTSGLLAGCSSSTTRAEKSSTSNRKAAPDFSLTDANGSRVKLSDYRGRVVLLNFWATWCGPCKIEIPWFIEFEKTYNNRGFAALGIALDGGGWKPVMPFVTQNGMNYPVLIGNDSVAQLYGGIDSLPTTLLIDRGGGIASIHVGLVTKHENQAEISTSSLCEAATTKIPRACGHKVAGASLIRRAPTVRGWTISDNLENNPQSFP